MAKTKKYCPRCETKKSIIDFHKNKSAVDGLAGYCRRCDCDYKVNLYKTSEKYRQKCKDYKYDKEKKKERDKKYRLTEKGKLVQKNHTLKHRYGIDVNGWNKLFELQNGHCAICGKHQSELNRKLDTDHYVKDGIKVIRGLLCSNCNIGIGNLLHNKNILKSAIKYLDGYNG